MSDPLKKSATATAPSCSPMQDLTENERAWIEFIRLASNDSDPQPTLWRVQQLQLIFRVRT